MKPSPNRPRGAFPKALVAAVLASITAASCWHPVFDSLVSASEITVRKLGEPKLYFTSGVEDTYGILDFWFLPQMTDTPSTGLLVLETEDSLEFRSFAFIDIVNHQATIEPMNGFETANSMGNSYMVQAYPDGSPGALIAVSPTDGWTTMMWSPAPTTITLPTPTTPAQFGMGAVAVSGFNQARIAGFAYDGLPRYEIFSAWASGDPFFMATPVTTLTFSAASQIAQPGKFLATAAWLYLSCGLDDGSRATFRWVNPPAATEPTRYPEDYGPLIGALSDGRLLAEQDGIISVLDPDLNKLFKFPAGRLRFVHERYDSLIDFEMKVVFTRSIFARNDSHDSDGQLLVELYEIPTDDLEDLAD